MLILTMLEFLVKLTQEIIPVQGYQKEIREVTQVHVTLKLDRAAGMRDKIHKREIIQIVVVVSLVVNQVANARAQIIRRHLVRKDQHQVILREVNQVRDRRHRKRQDLKVPDDQVHLVQVVPAVVDVDNFCQLSIV